EVTHHCRAAGIGADVVAFDDVAETAVGIAGNPNSGAVITADDISGRSGSPADGIVGSGDANTCLQAQACGPSNVSADVVAFHEVVLGATETHVHDVDANAPPGGAVARNNVPGPCRGAANGVVVAPDQDPDPIAESSQTVSCSADQVAGHHVVVGQPDSVAG